MTVLVTGAGGFVGGHLVDHLLERGEAVRALVRPDEDAPGLEERGAQVARGDVRDRVSLAAAVAGAERVVHCAARTGPWGPEAEYAEVNVLGTQNLVEAAVQAGVRAIVHVSSITVHGTDIRGTADETAPLQPASDPYSRTKAEAERVLRRLVDSGAPVTIVRPGLIYGPRDENSFGRFVRLIEQGRMPIIGSGRNHVPLIHVSDVARGIVHAAEAQRPTGRAYLLVSDEPVTQLEYFGAIAAELGVSPPRRHVPYHVALAMGATAETLAQLFGMSDPPPLMRFGVRQIGGENRFVGERARSELGFVPRVSLREGVRQSVAWFCAQQASSLGAAA